MEEKNGTIIWIIIFLIVLFAVFAYINIKTNNNDKNNYEVILIENLDVEINTEVYINSFIKEVKNGKLVNNDYLIDTTVLGKKELMVNIESNKEKKQYKFEINIVDTTKPEIDADTKITTFIGEKVNLLDKVEVSDNSEESIKAEVIGEYDFDKAGEYSLKYVAKDSSNNEVSFDFILSVIEKEEQEKKLTSKGYVIKTVDDITYVDGVLIVNKTYGLPKDFGNKLTNTTTNAFNKMKNAASAQNLNIYISSGFRSYQTQNTIYNNYVQMDGKEKADTYSARPGHSEHQTGLAFDLNTVDNSFADTEEGIWVNANAYKYGFIIRYPKGKESITGYIYEPWHLRYVGVELATTLYNNGDWISLEEYYGIDSKYND